MTALPKSDSSAPPGMDPVSLMVPDISNGTRWGTDAANWPTVLGGRRAFRVRGFTWFKDNVQNNISEIARTKLGDMEKEIQNRSKWTNLNFPWRENFAAAQVFAASQGKPLRFDKAAKTLLACELAAADCKIVSADSSSGANTPGGPEGLGWWDGNSETYVDGVRPDDDSASAA